MDANNFMDYFNDILNNYHPRTFAHELVVRRTEFENHLNEMWAIYINGNPAQIVEYNKQVESIKRSGGKVLRNSAGIHKIVIN